MDPGFAGIDNPLFVDPKTVMLFGDAKESVAKLVARRQGAVSVRTSRSSTRAARRGRVSPERAVEAVRDGVRRPCARRVDDAAEGVRHELPGGRLPRDARARRRPRAAEVGDVVPGQPGARAADGGAASCCVSNAETRRAAGGARRGVGDGAPHRRRGGARGGDARPRADAETARWSAPASTAARRRGRSSRAAARSRSGTSTRARRGRSPPSSAATVAAVARGGARRRPARRR